MKLIPTLLLTTIFSLFSLPISAEDKSDVPELTVDGLQLLDNKGKNALVWAKPGATLAPYKRAILVPPEVSFRRNWERDQRQGAMRISSRDVQRIKDNVRALFMEIFTEELEKGGYELVAERAEDVLLIKPVITNLDVTAPDIRTSSRSRSFARSAGSMTLTLELLDSVTDDIIVRAMDSKADRDNGHMQWQSGAANRQAAIRLMRPWAEALVEGLNEAHAVVNGTNEG